MRTCTPLVSVILPAYNAAQFIERTLTSVLSQSYKNLEILVVDDGSQDATANIVRAIACQDHRVTLLQQANQGVASARNLAISKSRGDYIAPIDADDIWYAQKIEKQVNCFLSAPASVGLVYAWSAFIDEDGYFTEGYSVASIEGDVYEALVHHNFIGNASAPLIRRTCFEQVGDYDHELRALGAQGCEDWDLYLRIAENFEFRVVPEFLIAYRQVSGSMSCDYSAMAKSFLCVMENARQRTCRMGQQLYQRSESDFYRYIGGLCCRSGQHQKALYWFDKALYLDLQTFSFTTEEWLRLYKTYKVLVISWIKLMVQPLATLIWKDHQGWIQFRRSFRWKRQPLHVPTPGQLSPYHMPLQPLQPLQLSPSAANQSPVIVGYSTPQQSVT